MNNLWHPFRIRSITVHWEVIVPLLLFVLVALTNSLLRIRFPITVTDTEYVNPGSFLDILTVLRTGGYVPFYRPVEYLLISWELQTFGNNYVPMIIMHTVLQGAVAVLTYLLVMELTRGKIANTGLKVFIAASSAILFCTSFRIIEVSWLILQKSMMTEIYVLTGLLGYLIYRRTGQSRWLIAVIIPGILGPMTRELPAALAIVILLLTIFSKKRDIKLALTAAFLSFHAVFPAFFLSLFLSKTLNLYPIFGKGMNRGLLIQEGIIAPSNQIHFDLPLRSALFFSPLAIILMFFSIALCYFTGRGKLSRMAGIGTLVVLVISLAAIYYPNTPVLSIASPILFTLVVCLPIFSRYGALLPTLFVVPLLPFIFIPVYDVWLRLSALAFIIIALLWIIHIPEGIRAITAESGRAWIRKLSWLKSAKLPVVLVVVLVIFIIPNLVMAESTFLNTINTHLSISEWVSQKLPRGSALVSNLRQAYDIQYYGNDHVTVYYLPFNPPKLPPYGPLPAGRGEPPKLLLQRLSSEKKTPMYFLTNDIYGRGGFPELPENNLKSVKEFKVDFSYIVLDPFQLLLPEQYVTFGGPTDLMFQSELKPGLFKMKGQTRFNLYEFVGANDTFVQAFDRVPAASGHGLKPLGYYKRYNLVADGATCFAIPVWQGEYREDTESVQIFQPVFAGRTMGDVKKAIDDYSHPANPLLLVDDYRSFMLIGDHGTISAIPRPEKWPYERAEIYIKRIKNGDVYPVFTGNTIGKVTNILDSNPYIGDSFWSIVLIEEGYRGFNIVANRGTLYAILQSDGAFDYGRLVNGSCTARFEGRTPEEIKEKIDNYSHSGPPFLVTNDYRGFMLIGAYGTTYAMPRPDGALKEAGLYVANSGDYFPVYTGKTIKEVISGINSNPYIGSDAVSVILVENGYRGFNIVANRGTLNAILQSDGAFDYNRLMSGPYTIRLKGRTPEEVKKAIDNYSHPGPPVLVIDDYRGFMLIGANGTTYAMPRPDGALKEAGFYVANSSGYFPVYTGKTIGEVITGIDSNPYIGGDAASLVLVENGYRGFNIVANKGTLYGILQSDGAFDYNRLINGPYTSRFKGRTPDEVKTAIDDYVGPELVEEHKGFLVIYSGQNVYGIPRPDGSLQDMRFYVAHSSDYFPVYTGKTIKEVTSAIDNNPYIGADSASLLLIEEGYKGFNIVANKGTLYAILQSDGAFSYNRLINGPYTYRFKGKTLDEVKSTIVNLWR